MFCWPELIVAFLNSEGVGFKATSVGRKNHWKIYRCESGGFNLGNWIMLIHKKHNPDLPELHIEIEDLKVYDDKDVRKFLFFHAWNHNASLIIIGVPQGNLQICSVHIWSLTAAKVERDTDLMW